jgi:hypothetical protein
MLERDDVVGTPFQFDRPLDISMYHYIYVNIFFMRSILIVKSRYRTNKHVYINICLNKICIT